jgi:NifU-like protein involved in Fe-S cluster formation
LVLEGTAGVPGDGPYVICRLLVKDGRAEKIDFDSNGCPSAHQATTGFAAFGTGRAIEQLLKMDAHDLDVIVGHLAEGKGYYADMTVTAFRNAVSSLS